MKTLKRLASIGFIGLLVFLGVSSNVNARLDKRGEPPLITGEEAVTGQGQQVPQYTPGKKPEVPSRPQYAPDEVSVKFKEGVEPREVLEEVGLEAESIKRIQPIKPAVTKYRKEYNIVGGPDEEVFRKAYKKMRPVEKSLYRVYKITLPEGMSVEEAIGFFKDNRNVESVQPNFLYHIFNTPLPQESYIPDDYYIRDNMDNPVNWREGSWGQSYPDMWGLQKIQAIEAYNVFDNNGNGVFDQGEIVPGEGVVVAVIDTGVDYNHEDLAMNIWQNSGEIPDNGIDDDGNGYVDDVIGYDFSDSDNNPSDYMGHGTHCSGTIAAVGDNTVGVIGVAPAAEIMPLKVFPNAYSDVCAQAIVYAAYNGADILSNSWGWDEDTPHTSDPTIEDAIDYAYSEGCVIVFSAGNDDMEVENSPQNHPNTIVVAATDYQDQKASFSNWGDLIDVAAPGVEILSLRAEGTDMYLGTLGYSPGERFVPAFNPNAQYYRANGTSMACPHVAGLAALILSKNIGYENWQIEQAIKASSDDILEEPGIYLGQGRVNAYEALRLNDICEARIDSPERESFFASDQSIEFYGTASGEGFADYTVEYKNCLGEWSPAGISSSRSVENGFLGSLDIPSIYDDVNIDDKIWFRLVVRNQEMVEFIDIVTISIQDAYIAYPYYNILERLPVCSGIVDITGIAGGLDFEYYVIKLYNPDTETWAAISEPIDTPVYNGILFRWDSTSINYNYSGQYQLRLMVHKTDGTDIVHTVPIAVFNLYIFITSRLDKLMMNDDEGIWGYAVGGEDVNALDHYMVEYGFVEDISDEPAYWMSEFLTLPNGGSGEVIGDTLAEVDLDSLINFWASQDEMRDKYMTMRVVLYTTGGAVKEERQTGITFMVHKQKEEWPFIEQDVNYDVSYAQYAYNTYYNPIVVDINKDGENELLIANMILNTSNDRIAIHLINSDGVDLPNSNWPVIIQKSNYNYNFTRDSNPWAYRKNFNTLPSPIAVGDVCGNDDSEIIFLRTGERGTAGTLYIIDCNGNIMNEVNLIYNPLGTLTLADIDGDIKKDILFISERPGFEGIFREIVVLDGSGDVKTGWPRSAHGFPTDGSSELSVFPRDIPMELAVGDLNGNGDLEIVVSTLEELESDIKSYILIYANDGSLLDKWEFAYADPTGPGTISSMSAPLLADMDGDSLPEICFSTAFETYVRNIDGTDVEGWPVICQDFDRVASNSPWEAECIAGDMEGDGEPELFIQFSERLWGWHSNGQEIPDFEYILPGDDDFFMGDLYRCLAMGDIDGDQRQEIIYSYAYLNGTIVHLFTADGEFIFRDTEIGFGSRDDSNDDDWHDDDLLKTSNYFLATVPVICDFDNDGDVDIIIGLEGIERANYTILNYRPFLEYFHWAKPRVAFWDLDAPYDPQAVSWPMHRFDLQHTGYYIPHPEDPSGGCFLAGTPILMSDGSTKPIEKLKVGDLLLAFDEETGELKPDKVKHVFVFPGEEGYLVITLGQVYENLSQEPRPVPFHPASRVSATQLKVTPHHTFYVDGKWVEAGQLKIGDMLLNAEGELEEIKSIKGVRDTVMVYNLEANPYNTFIAGGVVVHNAQRLQGAIIKRPMIQ